MKKIIMLALVFFSLASVTLLATNPSKIMNETQKEMKEEIYHGDARSRKRYPGT